MYMYVTGQICFQVNFDLTQVDFQPTVQPKNDAHTRSGARSCCTTRTRKQKCHIFVVYPQELQNTRSQKSLSQEATKITTSLKEAQKVVLI